MGKVLVLIFLALIFFLPASSYAQQAPTLIISPSEESRSTDSGQEMEGSQDATEAARGETTYNLPYPGILPDNPLYILKTIRDRIIGVLISDPLRKAEFNLLQADKRVFAGVMLYEKGKHSLSEETISKSANYFEQAIAKLEEAKAEGKDYQGFLFQIRAASRKHNELIVPLVEKSEGDIKDKLDVTLNRVEEFENRVTEIE